MAVALMLCFLWGWQDSLYVCALAFQQSSLGLNPDTAINWHPGVSQAGRGTDVRTVPQMDAQQGVLSTSISWWTLEVLWCPLWRNKWQHPGVISNTHEQITNFSLTCRGTALEEQSHYQWQYKPAAWNDAVSTAANKDEQLEFWCS